MTARQRRAERILGWYVLAVMAFLALPILVVIPAAFGPEVTLAFPPRGFSLKWFRNVVEHLFDLELPMRLQVRSAA